MNLRINLNDRNLPDTLEHSFETRLASSDLSDLMEWCYISASFCAKFSGQGSSNLVKAERAETASADDAKPIAFRDV